MADLHQWQTNWCRPCSRLKVDLCANRENILRAGGGARWLCAQVSDGRVKLGLRIVDFDRRAGVEQPVHTIGDGVCTR